MAYAGSCMAKSLSERLQQENRVLVMPGPLEKRIWMSEHLLGEAVPMSGFFVCETSWRCPFTLERFLPCRAIAERKHLVLPRQFVLTETT